MPVSSSCLLKSKISVQKIEEAFDIFNDYKSSAYLNQSLLSRLLHFVFESIRHKNQEAFNQIFESFERSLARDPEFEKILKKIGTAYLGIAFEGGFSIMSLVEGLFK